MACKPSNDELDEMILCCRYGDLEELVEFVQRFGDSWLESHTDENGNGALHMATANGHLEVVKYLLDHLPNKQALLRPNNPPAQNTPLHWAAMNHHLAILQLLCPRLNSQEISTLNGRGWSAMSEAVEGVGLNGKSAQEEQDDPNAKITQEGGPDSIPIREQCVNYLVEMMKLGEEAVDESTKPGVTDSTPLNQVQQEVESLRLDGQRPKCAR